jgi:Flp pilus assembly protein TadD
VLDPHQVADVQVAMGRVQERHGELGLAQASYLEAVEHDASRADACERLGILCDRQGKVAESRKWYDKARAARGPNPDLLCNQGYSEYLQGHWTVAETNLRQAIALDPGHCRAHNNLGLVLAQVGQKEEALAEFRNAGCSEAEARANLAFALALRQNWPEARAQYQRALSADPSSVQARQGLQQVTALMVKADPTSSRGPDEVSPQPVEGQAVLLHCGVSLGAPLTTPEQQAAGQTQE